MEIDSNPLKDLGEGIGKGVSDSIIKNGSSLIKSLIEKFKLGKLAFIQERTTLDQAKELLNSNEHFFYVTYIKDKEKQTLAVMGLTLRRLDQEGEIKRREKLVETIKRKFNRQDLHFVYLVQNGVLSRYITNLLEKVDDPELMERSLAEFIKNLDKFVYFIYSGQDISQVADTIKTKIVANSPEVFIISAMGSAVETLLSSFDKVKEEITIDYTLDIYSSQRKLRREIIFLERKED
jgi:hypothetical protein